MKKYQRIISILFFVFSSLGFLDATYLTVEHYKGSIPPCTIDGCEIVLTSAQSVIWGVPVALMGSVYYLLILLLSIYVLDSKKNIILKKISYITIFGFLGSIYFVYLQLFVIKNICQYCMISAGTSTALFILGMILLYKSKKENINLSLEIGDK